VKSYFSQILMELEFSQQILEKNIQISNFMTIRPVGAKLLHAGMQTDRHDETNSRYSQLCGRA
jgi:hypothetical protein